MKHPKNYSLPVSPSSSSSSSPSPTSPSNSEASTPPPVDASAFGSKGREFAGPGEWKLRGKAKDLVPFADTPEFVELLARSNFSFLQGASHPEEMVLAAKRLGYKGLAICDVNGLYGVVRGYQAAEKPSSFDAEQLEFANADGSMKEPFHYMCGSELTPYDSQPVVLIPMNKDGYVRLCHLITYAKRKAPKGHIVLSLEDICDKNEDLIAFPLPPWKEDHLKRLQAAFQDRVYLPVHKDFTWESIRTYQQALKMEQSLGILPFATGRPLFHDAARKPLHDVLTCILHGTTIQEAGTNLTLNRERYLKTPEQIEALFRERPDLVKRTLEIAARITFSLSELRYKYPQEHLPMGKTAAEHLRDLVEKGLRDRYGEHIAFAKSPDAKEGLFTTITGKKRTQPQMKGFLQAVRKQVEHELNVITQMEYEDYFLTLYEICEFATRQGILHQGRGSAANSVVCYALKLTAIDPLELGLLFERFISTERGEPPDIDIDFEHARREEVIQHIYAKYGDQRAAMVCTVICYRSRMAIREVAKVMGVPLKQVDALVKFMGREGLSRLVDEYLRPHAHASENLTHEGQALDPSAEGLDRGHTFDLAKIGLSPKQFQKLLRMSLELQGFPRHLGIHSGGFV
ncbi:MAG: PHP domain-containing protein, partial [Bdellovibrionota bacterium]